MDFLFTKSDADDPMARHDSFDVKYPGELLDSNWSSSHDILDSIFSMDNDFLNDYDHTKGFDTIDDLSKHIKMEAEEYQMTTPSYQLAEIPADINPSMKQPDNEFSTSLSSNSSDSGLSSDNLDIEMSPNYGPLSPTISSPGPSISERCDENKIDELDEPEIDVCGTQPDPIPVQKPAKVMVKKIPQIITLPNKAATSKFNIVNGKDIKIVKLAPQMLLNMNNKKVTMQVKNPVSPAKCQTSPGTFFINNGKLTEVKKLVRVQNISNPRSVLLPVSIQDVKDFKTFKIINTSSLKTNVPRVATATKITPVIPKSIEKPNVVLTGKVAEDSLSDNTSDGESIIFEDINSDGGKSPPRYHSDKKDANTSYPKLILTVEEKRLLAKEGIALPTHYPLTKHEERELKRIRRKIRNKISAQDSRKRKKEYVDGLEERVKQCTEENQTLMKRIKMLQTQNHNLMSQMKKLQTLLSKGTNKTTQPTTCLMVLLLSLALIAAPNLKLGQNAKESELEEAVQETMLQNRRNLLFDTNTQNTDILDEEINMSEIFSANDFNGEREFVTLGESCKSAGFNYESSCKKVKFIDFDIDEQNWYQTKETLNLQKSQNTFNNLAQEYQERKKSQQTSGFNIGEEMLDKDVVDMISPKSNGLYELNIEKGMDIHATSKHVYVGQVNNNLNSSELRQIQKY